VTGDGVQDQEPERDRDPTDQTNISALADDRMTAIRHANLKPGQVDRWTGIPVQRPAGP
jgi:hypothetical protein